MNIRIIITGILFQFFFSISVFGLNPIKGYSETLDQLYPNLNWKELDISSGELVTLKSWKLEPAINTENNDKLIIFSLPDSANMSHYIHPAASLALAGYQVLLFDYRGYGESTMVGHDEEELYKDVLKDDLLAVIRYAKENLKFKKIGIFGFSMGTLIAQMATLEQKVDFLIYESLIINPVMYASRLKSNFGINKILPENAFDFEKRMKKNKIKSLIFYGSKDVLITRGDMDRFVSQRKNRDLYVYEGNHLQGFTKLTNSKTGDQMIFLINNFFK